MKQNRNSFLAAVVIILATAFTFFTLYPRMVHDEEGPLNEFSSLRALKHVSRIASEPHYIGSSGHQKVESYLENELRKLGLEVSIQEGTSFTDWGNLTKSRNIIARIKGSGNSRALLLLSHYDSAPHSYSLGASDDAVGIATILECVRAFRQKNVPQKNDIILLFTDAEELGLNGAALFVKEHPWVKDVGLVLNFEARGTAGPSYMLMETNGGNSGLVNGFSHARPLHPVASSLMYSVYKMMPNDTDLTVFRKEANIPGFNFAFIDDHFNYHTIQDDVAHLDHGSLIHQGEYLMSAIGYFANANLSAMESDSDHVYFNIPFGFVSYPFGWIVPMLIVCGVLFLFFIFIGLGRRLFVLPDIGKGFLYFLGSVATSAVVVFFLWKLMLVIYPEYREIQQGFTYNGHIYMIAFVMMTLAISFLFYSRLATEARVYGFTIAPIFLWMVICSLVAVYLPGASFFIIPVFCSVLMLGYYTLSQRTNVVFNLILTLPAVFIFAPLIWMFPIGLGLKILAGSAALVSLVFGLMLPVFGQFRVKAGWAIGFFAISVGVLILAHFSSDFEEGRAKPNSLVYYYDADTKDAWFATYDATLDNWTRKVLGENPGSGSELNRNRMFSKYNNEFTHAKKVEPIEFESPTISFERDSTSGNWRYLKITISPNRKVNRYDIFAAQNLEIHNLKANGATLLGQEGTLHKRDGRKILSYYVVDNEPLVLEFSIPDTGLFDMELMESSFDLLKNPELEVPARENWMMPKPFVLTDAVILKQKIKPTPPEVQPQPVEPLNVIRRDTLAIPTVAEQILVDTIQ